MSSQIFRWRGVLLAPYGILLLILGQPSKASFCAGFIFALLGEALRIWGVGYAGKTTRKSTLDVPALATGGPYAFVRHPLYLGNSLMGLGGAVMAAGYLTPISAFVIFFVFFISYSLVYGTLIPLEENFLEENFKKQYQEYKASVPRLIPHRKPYPSPQGMFNFKTAITSEIHTLIPLLLVLGIMALKIR